MTIDKLIVRGAREHNLKNVSIELPRNALIVFTGLSGSGKTKLAQAYVQWICQEESQYRIIPVGADWTNREPLLGYPNALKPEEFQGGGFSISNLGMYGVKNFNAIINPPQGCIIAVGMSSKRAVIVDDKIEMRTMMDVNLSCDHRVVDGAVGSAFLNSFKNYLENPVLLLGKDSI